MYESCMTNKGCKCSEKDLMWPVVEIRRKIQMHEDFYVVCCTSVVTGLKCP